MEADVTDVKEQLARTLFDLWVLAVKATSLLVLRADICCIADGGRCDRRQGATSTDLV